jgi:hypothetical protein
LKKKKILARGAPIVISNSQSIEEVFYNESQFGHCHQDDECRANPKSSKKPLVPRNGHNSREEIFISLIIPA